MNVTLAERPTSLLVADPVEDATRREFVRLVGGGVFAAALVAACGEGDDGAEGTPTGSAVPAIRRVDTPRGPVDVPASPKRVVVFDRRGTLGYLLDLGVKPLAALSAPAIYGSTFHPLLTDATDIMALDSTEPSLEQVAGLNPDLIVAYTSEGPFDSNYEKLQAIAPTVGIPFNFQKPEEALTELGKVFGLEAKAADLRAAFQADVNEAKATLENPGTVSLILPMADQLRIYDERNLTGEILKGLGGTVVPDIKPLVQVADDDIVHVSYEQTNLVTGNTIVIFVNLSADYQAIRQRLVSHPLFQQLTAVKAGRVIEVESQANFGTAGLRGQRQVLDVLAKGLA
ncbi:MAG: ABC transporter substrate-binding protein [Dehalococcoidia bacterium]|nr:ABC transporter substrate-binding protein [Dehalococcoidia bacterium]